MHTISDDIKEIVRCSERIKYMSPENDVCVLQVCVSKTTTNVIRSMGFGSDKSPIMWIPTNEIPRLISTLKLLED